MFQIVRLALDDSDNVVARRPLQPLFELHDDAMAMAEFDDQQKQWLQGFVSGIEARKAADKLASRVPGTPTARPVGPDALQ